MTDIATATFDYGKLQFYEIKCRDRRKRPTASVEDKTQLSKTVLR